MFKEFYGFDNTVFTFGTAINIEDSHTVNRDVFFSYYSSDGMDYFNDNLSGNYFINECSVLTMMLIDKKGSSIRIPVRHFLGENPRMKIKFLQ